MSIVLYEKQTFSSSDLHALKLKFPLIPNIFIHIYCLLRSLLNICDICLYAGFDFY